jgi:hypothetical protein
MSKNVVTIEKNGWYSCNGKSRCGGTSIGDKSGFKERHHCKHCAQVKFIDLREVVSLNSFFKKNELEMIRKLRVKE